MSVGSGASMVDAVIEDSGQSDETRKDTQCTNDESVSYDLSAASQAECHEQQHADQECTNEEQPDLNVQETHASPSEYANTKTIMIVRTTRWP